MQNQTWTVAKDFFSCTWRFRRGPFYAGAVSMSRGRSVLCPVQVQQVPVLGLVSSWIRNRPRIPVAEGNLLHSYALKRAVYTSRPTVPSSSDEAPIPTRSSFVVFRMRVLCIDRNSPAHTGGARSMYLGNIGNTDYIHKV